MPAKKLLIADDSLTIQKVIKLALSNEGFDIKAVSDGNETLEQIALFQPDIILIDHSLPEKNAFEIKENYNQSPELKPNIKFVLMLSAYEDLDEARAAELEFNDRLVKPFDPAHLRKVIQTDGEKSVEAPSGTPQPPPLKVTPPPAPTPPPGPPGKPPSFSSKPPPAPDFDQAGEIASHPASNALKPADIETTDDQTFSAIQNDNLWDNGDIDEKTPSLPKVEFGDDDQDYVSGSHEEEDPIRGLADETISRSERGEFSNENLDLQWSVSDRLLRDDEQGPEITSNADSTGSFEFMPQTNPSIEPPPQVLDHGGNTIDLSEGERETETDVSIRRPRSVRPPPAPPKPPTPKAPAPNQPSSGNGPDIMPLSTKQMEEIIEDQLKNTLKKMIEKSLPEIAEKIVKEEIHKMLSDPPKGL